MRIAENTHECPMRLTWRDNDEADELRDMYANQSPSDRIILSLFDTTGQWSQPYYDAGYNVIEIDIKNMMPVDIAEITIDMMLDNDIADVWGVLAAPPCTHFTVSGSQYWKAKDADGRTDEMLELVRQAIRIIDFVRPAWWVIENPVGRLPSLMPELGDSFYVEPFHYGDAYRKHTRLWGEFNKELKRNEVEPVRACKAGSWLMQLGGKSEKTKAARSVTPAGFARAFFDANP